jgi:tetratricopeptide (TPR) repeat protein
MDGEQKIPQDLQSESAEDADFSKQFQTAIKSYAEAVETGRPEEADQAALSAFMLASMEAMNHPTPSLELAAKAQDCEAAGDWAGAETAHRARLRLEEQTGNDGLITKPNLDLSRLFRLIGNLEDARTFALAAASFARRTNIPSLVAMALENEAGCALERGDAEGALKAAEEALRILEPGKLTALTRAIALTMRARCLLAKGDLRLAEADLTRARELLEARTAPSFGAGPVVGFARWWEAKAEIQAKQQDWPVAAKTQARAVENRRLAAERDLSQGPHSKAALARSLEQFAFLLQQIGDQNSASETRSEANTIWRSIHLPTKAKE